MKRKLLTALVAVGLIAFTTLGIANVKTNHQKIELQEVQLQDKSAEIKSLQLRYDHLNIELDKADSSNKQQIQKLQQEKDQLQQQKQKLEADLQAKRANQQAQALALQNRATLASPKAYAAVVAGCGDNSYAQYIYQHESGCNLNAVNAGGCRGIGQACPGSKLPCGADYGCQNAFFTNYANQRYGGWAGAYSFWLSNHWW